MQDGEKIMPRSIRTKLYVWGLVMVWTGCIVTSLVWIKPQKIKGPEEVISIPMTPFRDIDRSFGNRLSFTHGFLWLIGILGIGLGNWHLKKQIQEHKRAEEEKHQRQKLEGVIEMAGVVCHKLNQPLQAVYGYSELALMELPAEDKLYDKIVNINRQVDKMGEITRKLGEITRQEQEMCIGDSI